jgi:hypothetical protein
LQYQGRRKLGDREKVDWTKPPVIPVGCKAMTLQSVGLIIHQLTDRNTEPKAFELTRAIVQIWGPFSGCGT